MPCGSRTRLARLEAWHLCRSAKGTLLSGGRRGSRTLKAHRSTAFEAAAIAYWLALPYQVRTAGFEPAISCARGARNTKLSHVLNLKAPSGNRTRASAMARQQATSTSWALVWLLNCQRSRAPGRTRSRRRRITGAESSPLNDQCLLSVGSEGLEPSPVRLRAGDAAASTLIPSFCFSQW